MDRNATPAGAVPLAAAIEALRGEILQVWNQGQGQQLRFRPSSLELTLEVAVTSTVGVEGGIKWWLLSAEGNAEHEKSVTQSVSITLDPVIVDLNGFAVGETLIDDVDVPASGESSSGPLPD